MGDRQEGWGTDSKMDNSDKLRDPEMQVGSKAMCEYVHAFAEMQMHAQCMLKIRA